jgi:hypothetical protein
MSGDADDTHEHVTRKTTRKDRKPAPWGAGIDLSDDILHGDEGTFARRHC